MPGVELGKGENRKLLQTFLLSLRIDLVLMFLSPNPPPPFLVTPLEIRNNSQITKTAWAQVWPRENETLKP